ncbi:MAG: hypothetical protein GY722_03980, partial [bacterium]|nr:hypothetical protein [bacterium]
MRTDRTASPNRRRRNLLFRRPRVELLEDRRLLSTQPLDASLGEKTLTLHAGEYQGEIADAGNIVVDADATIVLTGDTWFRA